MELNDILKVAMKGGASDIHLKAGLPPMFRVDGKLRSGTTPGSSRARQVLKALKLSDHRPPTPPPHAETTM